MTEIQKIKGGWKKVPIHLKCRTDLKKGKFSADSWTGCGCLELL